jgi:hypothetical protein
MVNGIVGKMASWDAENNEQEWKPEDEVTTTVGTIWRAQDEAFREGVAFTIERIKARICFDHNSMGCDHQACYELQDLARMLADRS